MEDPTRRAAPDGVGVSRDQETVAQQAPGRVLARHRRETDRTRPDPTSRVRAAPKTEAVELADVDVGPTVGAGGMALVHLGHQRKLDRAVAVKTLRSERRGDEDVDRLTREARITGRLEHPNIVPVHDLVFDKEGTPRVVLKLIEGQTWKALMHDAEGVQDRFGAEDLLEWNLTVLMSVCRALSFAHSRGILHRDVKPSNIMVGPFGEVYLLDWGIAYDLDDPDGRVVETSLSGTTSYMAPEQLDLDAEALGPWTDTYLLGATLHHLLSEAPPFADQTLEQRVARMFDGEPVAMPPLPPETAPELRGIIERAMHPDPAMRWPDAEPMRLALARFLEHRTAARLVVRGDRARDEAEEAMDDAAEERAAQRAEVAYRTALEEWPSCEEARDGLRGLAVARIGRALARGEPHAAARLFEAHNGLPSGLGEQVQAALDSQANDEKALRQLVTDADRGLGHGARGAFGAIAGVVWLGFWTVGAFYPPPHVGWLIGFTLGFLVIGFGLAAWRAPQLFSNRINRTSVSIVVVGLLATAVWCAGGHGLGLSMVGIQAGLLLVWAVFASCMAILIDRWGTISAVGFAACFLTAAYIEGSTAIAIVVGNLVLIANQVVLNLVLSKQGFVRGPAVGSGNRRVKPHPDDIETLPPER
ncbi:MAG: bifunctional serine/threonine protein kinase/MFS transporter [Sandaracinaceae bacterium]